MEAAGSEPAWTGLQESIRRLFGFELAPPDATGAHILAGGDLRSLVFFGGFLLVALVGTLSMDRRKRANPDFPRFAAVTSHVPFVAIAQGRTIILRSSALRTATCRRPTQLSTPMFDRIASR